MTKNHPMHRKKAIHMTFRRSKRVRGLYWHVQELLDKVMYREKKGR